MAPSFGVRIGNLSFQGNELIENMMGVTRKVREFYEHHPYPPPIDDLDQYRTAWDNLLRRRADAQLFWPTQKYREDRQILIAGCGTSQAAKYAMRWPNAKVTGIDVSAHSIERTKKLKQKYKLDNLKVKQLELESAAQLGEKFDYIVSTGVLHHLPDPESGLSALSDCLAPRGAMHLMLYAPYGRAGIYLIQKYCRRLGIGSSSAEIRDLATSLRALPPDHPLIPLLRNSLDFKNEAALADALLHPQDRSYSVDQLFEYLGGAGLQFGRWIRQAPYLPQCGGLTQIPHCDLLAQLPMQEQFAAVEEFRGNMLRHSAIVYHAELDEPAQPVNFDGNHWLDYIPIPIFGTIVVEERLPAGAAAVLINRAHTQTDIYLPVSASEKKIFNAIDGECSVRDLIGITGNISEARSLFIRLWLYDQVVFDASCQRSRNDRRESHS